MRDGNIAAAVFDGPESVAIHTLNETKAEMARNFKPVWLANTSDACINSTQANYTKCGVIIDKEFPYDIIDHNRVKYISFGDFNETKDDIEQTSLVLNAFIKTDEKIIENEDNNNNSTGNATEEEDKADVDLSIVNEDRHVYVADTNNHCIRKIVLK